MITGRRRRRNKERTKGKQKEEIQRKNDNPEQNIIQTNHN